MKTLVMQGRRRWMIGADIGLSRDYLFIGGDIVAVPDEDAAILLDRRKTGDHVFLPTETPEAAAVLAEAEARAAETAKGWKSPGKCCDDDVVGEVDEGEDDPHDGMALMVDPDSGTTEPAEATPSVNHTPLRDARLDYRTVPRSHVGGPAGRK